MKNTNLLVAAIALVCLSSLGCSRKSEPPIANGKTPKKTMRPFKSDDEFRKFVRELPDRPLSRAYSSGALAKSDTAGIATLPSYADSSITNVQHAGVDEGGIVKLHGKYLVVLRRGRLFTIDVGNGELKPVSFIDSYGPDIDPQGTWYDELLISGSTIIVIGYSYVRGGTEIGLFNIDDNGNLSYRSTYHLRANDYYSSRNYASRLVQGKLIFYSPLYIYTELEDALGNLPALRKWHKDASADEFKKITSATNVYRPEFTFSGSYMFALHTITVCDPFGIELQCTATSVIGPRGHAFYVSPESVYVWATDRPFDNSRQPQSLLYRMPLDGSAPSALKVSGSPIDQFSFLESSDNYLNVLVREKGSGDTMWYSEVASGPASLLRVSLASFSDGGEAVSAENYRKLPTPEGESFQNRFVGDYLLYGIGAGWLEQERKIEHAVYALRWFGGDPVKLPLSHYVDRIEQMGDAAVVVGVADRDLHFSALSLGNVPKVENDYVRKEAAQGEKRSHGFFYKPDGTDSGVLGLPISEAGEPGHQRFFLKSASILYLRNSGLHFEEIGNLTAKAKEVTEDNCKASCYDWYGQSRPLFLQNRVFALLGYELVEGAVTDGKINEVRRLNYSPSQLETARK